jgi:hypothetical protein
VVHVDHAFAVFVLNKMVQVGGRCSMIAYPASRLIMFFLIMLLMDSNDNRNTIIVILHGIW